MTPAGFQTDNPWRECREAAEAAGWQQNPWGWTRPPAGWEVLRGDDESGWIRVQTPLEACRLDKLGPFKEVADAQP